MISGYKLVPERVSGRCTGCVFSNKSFGDRFCPEVPCSNTAQGGLGVQAIAVPLNEPDYQETLKGKAMCRASEDLLYRIRGGAEFPDAAYSVAQKFGVNQQELEAEYDRLTTN
jgi:hypothetical protein